MAQGSSKGGLNRGVPYKNIGMTLSECIFLFKSQYSKIAYADRMNCLFPYINKMVCDRIPISLKDFEEQLNICKLYIFERSNDEIAVLNAEIQKIEEYTKEQAIKELIKSRKLNEKISAILSYKSSL